jgi:hypothetical protein
MDQQTAQKSSALHSNAKKVEISGKLDVPTFSQDSAEYNDQSPPLLSNEEDSPSPVEVNTPDVIEYRN